MAMIHATASHSECQTGPPWVRARMALAVWLIGLLRAKTCSHLGIDCTGTKTELAKTSGKIQMKPAAWAASGSRTLIPMRAEIHEKASPKNTATAKPTRPGMNPPWKRNPMADPTAVISTTTKTLRTVSDSVRPASTAERAIGSERNRSTIPRERSAAGKGPSGRGRWPWSSAGSLLVGALLAVLFRGPAGEGQEDVIQARSVEAEVFDLDPRLVEQTHGVGQHRRSVLDGNGDP